MTGAVTRAAGTAPHEVRPLAAGDVIAIAGSGHARGDRGRSGVVAGIVGREVYRVRWADGRETMFRPGDDVLVVGQRARMEGGRDAAGRDP